MVLCGKSVLTDLRLSLNIFLLLTNIYCGTTGNIKKIVFAVDFRRVLCYNLRKRNILTEINVEI